MSKVGLIGGSGVYQLESVEVIKNDAFIEKVMDARRSGSTYGVIAKQYGISRAYAHLIVKDELARLAIIAEDLGKDVVQLEVKRLDHMLKKLESKVDAGDSIAITTTLKIMERRSKFLGSKRKN